MSAAPVPVTLPPGLAQPLSWVGLPWPAADQTRLSRSAQAWLGFARSVRLRRDGADAAAGHVVKVNDGRMIEAHDASWTAARGPTANLARTVAAAEHAAVALQGLSSAVTELKRAYVRSLQQLVSTANAAGLLVPDGRGGVAVAAGGAGLVTATRAAMVEARDRTIATTTTTLNPLLERSREALILARGPGGTLARPGLSRPTPLYPYRPDQGAGPRPVPRSLRELKEILDQRVEQNVRDRNRQCPARGDLGLPDYPFVSGRGTDPRTMPWRSTVWDIHRGQSIDGSSTTTVNGIVSPWPSGLKRVNYQDWMLDLRDGIDLPLPGSSEAYHASHLWGPMLGTEVAAGIGWAPSDINLGVQKEIETNLRTMGRGLWDEGGYLMVRARATMFGAGDWPDGPLGEGRHFVRSVDYYAIPCRPDGTMGPTRHFGYELTPPTGTVAADTFRAGRFVRLDGVQPPMLNRLP
ncbi:polymorphic toxin type 4 domain-containing protein [Virgisporangium ochraceum]|uniref:Bacterial toxin 4 domain-containing protein n=1 Tax=Virgisporangium ochraceum TaxID=65505 RepID=A0A8J3ZXN8_9ACTN|nr:polymorphic toxin type 4 domain-containing protein [Virgisporangium ochraceum]GIJ70395.1 hypothetical protein Voc01_053120 [Virgisporangium ochraceum]